MQLRPAVLNELLEACRPAGLVECWDFLWLPGGGVDVRFVEGVGTDFKGDVDGECDVGCWSGCDAPWDESCSDEVFADDIELMPSLRIRWVRRWYLCM